MMQFNIFDQYPLSAKSTKEIQIEIKVGKVTDKPRRPTQPELVIWDSVT